MSELPTPRSVRSPQGGAADRGERDGRGVADVERVDVRTQWDAYCPRRSFHRPPIEAGALGAEDHGQAFRHLEVPDALRGRLRRHRPRLDTGAPELAEDVAPVRGRRS